MNEEWRQVQMLGGVHEVSNLGRKYGVVPEAISAIKLGKNWSWLGMNEVAA